MGTTSAHANHTKGFTLPTVLIIATSLMVIGAAVLQGTHSVKLAVDAQFYNQLAREAAEAGIVYAQNCVDTTGVAEWDDISPLTPDVACDGTSTGNEPYVFADFGTNYRTTFSVTSETNEVGDIVLRARGTTELVRPHEIGQEHADREVYRTHQETLVEESGSTSRSVKPGATAISTHGGRASSAQPGEAQAHGSAPITMNEVVNETAAMYYHGYNHVAYAAGYNGDGQLGNGNSTNQSELSEFILPGDLTTKRVVTAGVNTFVIASDGQVYGAGENADGQLGNGTTTNTSASNPVRFDLPSGILAVDMDAGGAGAGSYTVVVGSDGELYGSGSNSHNQLWVHDNANFTSPVNMAQPGGQRVQKVAVVNGANNNQSVVAITEEGDVYGRGRNNYGQIHGGDTLDDQSTWGQLPLPGDRKAVDIETGYYNTYIQTTDGKMYGFGKGYYGQLGNGSTIARQSTAQEFDIGSLRVRDIAIGSSSNVTETGGNSQNSAYVLASDNQVYGAGQNHKGQLGDGTTTNRSTPVKLDLPGSLTAHEVKTMYYTTCVLASDRQVYCVGDNKYGQLGQGDTTDRSTAVQFSLPSGVTAVDFAVGYATVHVVGSDGETYAAGRNNAGQLGVGDTSNKTTPVTVTAPVTELERTPRSGSMSHVQTNILDTNGDVWSTGDNQLGQFGNGNTSASQDTPVRFQLPSGYALDVRGGVFMTQVLSSNGQLYGAGRNHRGQLGVSDTGNHATPVKYNIDNANTPSGLTVRQYSTAPTGLSGSSGPAGNESTLIVASDNLVYGTGYNEFGQLGNGSTSQVTVPSSSDRFRLPSGVTAEWAYFGDGADDNVSFVRGSNGELYAAGRNFLGQLGIGNTSSPVICSTTCPTVNTPSGVTFTDVSSAGYFSSYFLGSDNMPYATGLNDYGQLGLGNTTNQDSPVQMSTFPSGERAVKIEAGTGSWGAAVYVLASDGQLYAAGRDTYGQLGRNNKTDNTPTSNPNLERVEIPSGLSVLDFWVGQENVFMLTSDGQVYGAGRNDSGQLGIGNTTAVQSNPQRFQLPAGVVARDVITQFASRNNNDQWYFTGVLGSDGKLYVAGNNDFGQLTRTDNPVATPRAYTLPQPSPQPGLIF